MFLCILTTGGTIDKIYFDAQSRYEVGEPEISRILHEALVGFDYKVRSLFRKDSLELTDVDRGAIRAAVLEEDCERVLITHGTDTMVETAASLEDVPGKTIVLTGALAPARFRATDAIFNIGMAVAAVQTLAPGVYIAMNGRIFRSGEVRKNRQLNCFESTKERGS